MHRRLSGRTHPAHSTGATPRRSTRSSATPRATTRVTAPQTTSRPSVGEMAATRKPSGLIVTGWGFRPSNRRQSGNAAQEAGQIPDLGVHLPRIESPGITFNFLLNFFSGTMRITMRKMRLMQSRICLRSRQGPLVGPRTALTSTTARDEAIDESLAYAPAERAHEKRVDDKSQ